MFDHRNLGVYRNREFVGFFVIAVERCFWSYSWVCLLVDF